MPKALGFEARLDRSGPCWLWTGTTNGVGYGQIRIDGKRWTTHRLAWTLAYGPIPEGMCVLHRCDTRACCNPEHLFLGTVADNNRDMGKKGRAGGWIGHNRHKTHCPRGHPYSLENTYAHVGGRHCRICKREADRRYQSKKVQT
jgi:hypothetical protein